MTETAQGRALAAAAAVSAGCLLVACAASGCGTDAAAPDLDGGARVGCIYGGTAAPGGSGLTPAEVNAVVDLDISGGDEGASFGGSCTGLLVADRWVLTAAHCTRDPASTRVLARFGPTGTCTQPPAGQIPSAEVVVHPTLDLMLVRLAALPAVQGIAVVPVTVDPEAALQSGELLHLAGFGRSEQAGGGELRFAAEPISALTDDWIEVDGNGRSGACVADSGGPLFRRQGEAATRTVGVLSRGSSDCLGKDQYVRLSTARAWLATFGVVSGEASPELRPRPAP